MLYDKIDRTHITRESFSEADRGRLMPVHTPELRAKAFAYAYELICMAYQIDPANPPRLERDVTKAYMRKR